jgi:hypothetical protein
LATQSSVNELEQRYRAAHEPRERTWWQILWLLTLGQTATAIVEITGYTRTWIGGEETALLHECGLLRGQFERQYKRNHSCSDVGRTLSNSSAFGQASDITPLGARRSAHPRLVRHAIGIPEMLVTSG